MLDKIAKGMNNGINPKLNMTSFQLLKYNHNHKINFTRVDEKRNNLFNLNYFFFAYILIAKSGYLHLARGKKGFPNFYLYKPFLLIYLPLILFSTSIVSHSVVAWGSTRTPFI